MANIHSIEISENIGRGSGLRGSARHSACARDHDHDDYTGRGDRHDDNRVGDDHERRHYCELRAGFGLYYVPFVDGPGPGAVLLYQRHDHS
jgi:hypothetical protein